MDPLSIASATISLLDICLRCGKDLYHRCQAYRRAEVELREATLWIQNHWIKIEHQISALRTVWKALSEELQIHQSLVMQVLQTKLQNAIHTLDSLVGGQQDTSRLGRVMGKLVDSKRLKYAAYAKSSLDGIIEDLERWQRMFDPSWFFLARIAVPAIDVQLDGQRAAESTKVSAVVRMRQARRTNIGSAAAESVFLEADYETTNPIPIAYSSACTGHHTDQGIIIDHIPAREQSNIDSIIQGVESLARVLSKVNPDDLGLLSCQGVIKKFTSDDITGFNFIFSIPATLRDAQAYSLRSLLLDKGTKYPLNERLNLAASLARSVVFLHSSGLVHKNISPENIIVFQKSPDTLGTPFLVGFEQFRSADGQTYMSGDTQWERNLYRHPKRQGLYPEEEYHMQHDMYSVGVCLLEIGIWSSFAIHDSHLVVPGPDCPITEILQSRDQRRVGGQVKHMLVRMAESQLPLLMGRIYTDVVLSCLTSLDKNNKLFGKEEESEEELGFIDDGIPVGVRYIEKILFELEKITV